MNIMGCFGTIYLHSKVRGRHQTSNYILYITAFSFVDFQRFHLHVLHFNGFYFN